MGFYNGAGIHGTDETWSIGRAASHGCIRMTIPDVEELYDARAAAHADLRRAEKSTAPKRRPFPSVAAVIGLPHRAHSVLAAPLRVARSTGTGLAHVHVTATSPASPASRARARRRGRVHCAPAPRWPWLSVP